MKVTGPTAPLIAFVGSMITVTALFDIADPKRLDHQQRFFITLAISVIVMMVLEALTDWPEDDL